MHFQWRTAACMADLWQARAEFHDVLDEYLVPKQWVVGPHLVSHSINHCQARGLLLLVYCFASLQPAEVATIIARFGDIADWYGAVRVALPRL
jgi:hypothetical protein